MFVKLKFRIDYALSNGFLWVTMEYTLNSVGRLIVVRTMGCYHNFTKITMITLHQIMWEFHPSKRCFTNILFSDIRI